MKKLLALMLCAVASSAMAQTNLSAWNDQTNTQAGVKVLNVPLGSGAPSNDDTVKFTAATSLGNGVCEGYTITPSIGRGEYVYIQPIIKK
jgi:hypothetical protein